MHPSNQEKTSFVTYKGLHYYKVMRFRLKNAATIYQRLVNKMFASQIERNMEVYVGGILVKSGKANDHIKDLKENFKS